MLSSRTIVTIWFFKTCQKYFSWQAIVYKTAFNTIKGIAKSKDLSCISILECDLVIIHRHTEIAVLGLTHCSALEERGGCTVEENTQ